MNFRQNTANVGTNVYSQIDTSTRPGKLRSMDPITKQIANRAHQDSVVHLHGLQVQFCSARLLFFFLVLKFIFFNDNDSSLSFGTNWGLMYIFSFYLTNSLMVPIFFPGRESCKLYCMADGYDFYFALSSRVIDGTPCHKGSHDVCVNGRCEVSENLYGLTPELTQYNISSV